MGKIKCKELIKEYNTLAVDLKSVIIQIDQLLEKPKLKKSEDVILGNLYECKTKLQNIIRKKFGFCDNDRMTGALLIEMIYKISKLLK